MGQVSLTLPTAGSTPNATADPELVAALNALAAAINGGLDATNISAALAQAAMVNQTAQTVKGAVNITASQSLTSTTYALMPTADQVQGLVLPTNGLISVWYQATWQESVAGAGRAALFLGSNQVKIQGLGGGGRGPQTQAAATNSGFGAVNVPLCSHAGGLVSADSSGTGYLGDVTTGQIVGFDSTGTESVAFDLGGTLANLSIPGMQGAPCTIFAAAGTYTVSVQFRSSSGSVTASNRKLWVQAWSPS